MPLKIRSLSSIVIILFCCMFIGNAQHTTCMDVDDSGFIKKAYDTFEQDLFKHYHDIGDTTKIYRKFLLEIANLSIDLRKLPSDNAIQIARNLKKNATHKNSIWVKLSDYEKQEATQKSLPIDNNNKKSVEQEIYTFNYRGDFIQCLKNYSQSEDFKDIITLLESDANISTSLIAQRMYYMTDEEINSTQIKNFIAFDIYFSILMVIEKAFG